MRSLRFGCRDEAVGFRERWRDRFFDEDVDAGFEQRAADFGMPDGGHGKDGGIHVADHVAIVGRCRGAFTGEFARAGEIRIDDEAQFGLRILPDDAHVILAERAHADDGHAASHAPPSR